MTNSKETKAIKTDKKVIFLFPIISGILTFLIVSYILSNNPAFIVSVEEGMDDFKTVLSIWGTLLGFMIAAIAIIITLGNDIFVKLLKDTGHYNTILYSYGLCCIHLFLAVILALVCIFFRIWEMNVFIILCAVSVDIMVIVAICLYFLLGITNKMNKG